MASSVIKVETVKDATASRAKTKETGSKSVRVEIVNASDLRQHEDAWWNLSDRAVAPNAFYDPWMLLPAIESAQQDNLRFLLVSGPVDKQGIEPLWGLFPLSIESKCLHLPIRTLAFWQHRNCRLTVPLIDAGHIWEVLDAFWRWFEKNPFKCRVLDTNYLAADGRFHEAWADFAIGRTALMLRDFPRALFVPSASSESYISRAVSKKHSDHFLRQQRRLSELGRLECLQVEDLAQVDAWVDQFLALEAKGWKGEGEGNAFAKNQSDAAYFRNITHEGFKRNRVVLQSLNLNGEMIAMKHNLRSQSGAFVFRITYDETYAKYSPGLLLELENIRSACHGQGLGWMDSCTSPRHPLFNRIWSEHRMIRRTLFSNGSRLGDFWVSIIPLFRWVSSQVRPQPAADYLQISTKGADT
jgi:CelD/BcsL family acetyltransferase involved in cellulose biosynthesis